MYKCLCYCSGQMWTWPVSGCHGHSCGHKVAQILTFSIAFPMGGRMPEHQEWPPALEQVHQLTFKQSAVNWLLLSSTLGSLLVSIQNWFKYWQVGCKEISFWSHWQMFLVYGMFPNKLSSHVWIHFRLVTLTFGQVYTAKDCWWLILHSKENQKLSSQALCKNQSWALFSWLCDQWPEVTNVTSAPDTRSWLNRWENGFSHWSVPELRILTCLILEHSHVGD